MATILVVDDEAALRGVMRRALERAGHQVTEAANGDDALAVLDARAVDLVITDVIMPERGGVATIREMRRRRNPAKILVITGGGPGKHMEYLGIAEIFGADRALPKPFKVACLVDTVAEMLAGRTGA